MNAFIFSDITSNKSQAPTDVGILLVKTYDKSLLISIGLINTKQISGIYTVISLQYLFYINNYQQECQQTPPLDHITEKTIYSDNSILTNMTSQK